MASGHTFRNPDKFQVLAFRDWIRKHLPSGSAGCVVEDLDLVMRVYGKRYGTDSVGKFMFVELKFGDATLGRAQINTFRMIDDTCRKGDPECTRYMGYFLLQYSDEDWDDATFRIDGLAMPASMLAEFLQMDDAVLDHIRTNGRSPLIR